MSGKTGEDQVHRSILPLSFQENTILDLDCYPKIATRSPLYFLHDTGVWTQSFGFGRQVLYCLSYNSRPFCSAYFGDRALLFAQAYVDCWNDRHIPPCPAFFHWDGVLWIFFFLSQLAGTMILPISASQVASMTNASHCAQTLVEMGAGLTNFLPRLAPNPPPPSQPQFP
jgi:hypothetical protein